MKYELYRAIDSRDNKPMYWLHDTVNHRVAVFSIKTAPSRIKQRTAAAPESIVWEPENVLAFAVEDDNRRIIDEWGFQS